MRTRADSPCLCTALSETTLVNLKVDVCCALLCMLVPGIFVMGTLTNTMD